MARLIPRKQIEEQQNITGSLEIGQDLLVGNNSIVAGNSVISGSLEVLQDFFLGDQLSDRGEITGSVFLTGSLEIDGQLIFAGPEAVLSATASNALLAQDTLRYEGIRAKDFGANVPTLYVSSTDGDDTNDGRTIQFPLRTIKRAAQLAQPGYDGRYGFDTGSIFNGYVIKVQAGTYLEDNPVILPSNTTIWGSGLRITKVNARNPEQDLFWVNSGCYIAEITMGGLRLWPNEKEPQRGFGVAFQPGAFITTSPYVQNCSQISNQENSFTELYEEIPPGGGGLYVNGDAVDPNSPLASMVLDAYTQISPNGVGCLVNGRGFIQLVSFFTNFSYYAIRVNNGGHATLNNSNISFGLYGMYASGSRFISGSGGNIDARNKVRASYSVIVDVLNKGLEVGLPSVTTKNTAAGIRATSTSQYPQYTTSSGVVTNSDRANEIVADFELVSQIVDSGTSDFPTLIAKSSTKGYGANSPYNILGTPQITSSVSASSSDLDFISASYGAILDIFNDGTASYQFVSNTSASIKVTDTSVTPLSPSADYSSSLLVSSSFVTIYNIIAGGVDLVPTLVSNNSSSIKVTDETQFTTGVSSSLLVRNSVSASFSIVYNILANGTGSSILDIPQNHQKTFTVRKSNDSTKYTFGVTGSGNVDNASLTLFRGETYRFFVSAGLGTDAEPFFIRKQPVSGFDYQNIYNYDDGVINNGDSNGIITFQVPYDAPNKLYYISQDTPSFVGEINIYNSSTTPKELIANTLTYPATLASSSVASTDVDKINGYDLLINNIPFIQSEVIEFVSSSWSDFAYNEASCSRDVAFIVNGVAYDLLYGGNEESIRSGLFYYQFPSEATTTQLGPTLTAVKYAAGMAQRLLENRTFVDYDTDKYTIAESIRENKLFVQNETIAYLSSSWSGFPYNETKCKRDVGYILDAVATDLVYGGNERAIDAGVYYYLYPSLATVANTTTGQLNQTLDGIKYAAGTTINIITGSTFVTQSESRLAAAELLIDNKELIQDETIQYINVQYPTLDYNTSKCRRDVGYILDAVATDLIYGGNESSTRAGRFYYLYPSVATSTQRRETRDGFLYSKVIGESIVQNIILETPRIITNDERLIKVTGVNNVTESLGGTDVESSAISSSFAIIEQIIKRGVGAINSAITQNSNLNWRIDNPISVTTGSQTTSSYVQPNELITIKEGFERVNSIIEGGVASIPPLTSSVDGLIKITNGTQTTGSAISSDLTSSISSSFGYVVRVISGGTGSLEPIRLNTSASIKVTTTPQWISSNIGTNYETSSISSSFGTVINIINNGLSVRPTLISNTSASVKLTSIPQYVSASYSGSLEDIQFISQSVSKVTQIIETGNVDLFGKTIYSTTASGKFGVYEIIKNNIEFIKEETIAYLSSSWSTFEYDSVKCRRDVGLIISGAAEDLLFNANSASIVNGQFYYEYPSQATGSQLAQTLDGINYASRLAQKLITNGVTFSLPATEISASNALLFNNKEFIQNETIAYLSSSWGGFDYNETTCKRDVGYIIDAVRTDLVYGGNERSRVAGEYYYLYPSAATGSQLLQTTDGILYASRLAQSIVSGSVFVSADSDKVEASRLLRENKSLIANEVVEYVSSSWSGVLYDDIKCKRDVGYIIDAVRTDLVYGGNERSTIAGDFYYRFPSAATVAGVPTSTAQLDPTVTGVEYANRLSQTVILSEVLSQPSQSITDAAELIRESRDFIQQNTIDFVYEKYPNFTYDVVRCRRDTGFIVDAVVTDLVYGGNERTSTAGYFYYKYPSQATNTQVEETVAAINYAKELTKLIAVDKRALEETFDSVDKVILSGSVGVSSIQLVKNTQKGIVVTNSKRVSQANGASDLDTQIVSSSFGNVINIINNGTGSIPTQIRNTERGINRIGGTQITSSLSVDTNDKNTISSSFDIVLDIVENGLGSIPTLVRNSVGGIKVTSTPQYVSASSATSAEATLISASIAIVADIVTNGTSSILTSLSTGSYTTPTTDNNKYIAGNILKENISFIQNETIAYLSSSWSTASYDEAKCRRDVGLILSASAEDLIWNSNSASVVAGKFYYDYPSQAQGAQLNQTLDGIRYAGELAQKVVVGTTLVSPSTSKLTAYNLLLDNKRWIQNQTIALINSNIVTQSYNETTCRRDVGYIVDAVATDLLWGGNQRSSDAGRFYYLYPSAATGSQLDQTLEGIGHAKTLSVRIVNNELIYSQFTSSITPSLTQQTKVGSGFDIVLDIIENGTGSLPTLVTNASGLIRRTDSVQYQTTASIANTLITSSNNSFDIVLDIVKEGTGSLPTLVKNAAGLLRVTNSTPYYSGIVISGSRVNGITGSFDTIISILEDGIGSTPTIYKNTVSNIRTTGAQQYISASSATQTESTIISASISIVTNIIANGTGSIITALPTSSYVSTLDEDAKWIAYGILKENIGFIQDETIAYLSSSWSTASYIEEKCRRDVGLIVSGAAEDLLFGSVSASVVNGKFYYEYPSQAQGAQLNQTLDGIFYASELAQKLIRNVEFNLPSSQSNAAYDLVVLNKPFIQNEVIAYISSSWSTHIYSESVCRRDVGYILDAVATDIKWGGNQRSVTAGQFYYLYPSEATGSQIQETVTGVKYAKNLVEQILRGRQFTQVPHNRLEAKELIFNNKEFIQNEVIEYVSASWNGFQYVEETCKRDVGYILDATITDLVYGGNERSLEAGEFYYRYPSTATSTQLGPTLSGIRHAKNMVDEILQSNLFVTASISQVQAYNLLLQNKELIQNETIAYVESAWSFFEYNEGKCRRDTGYIVDAVATDILYGGNERVREAGEYYYLYPSLATVNNNTTGQLDETLDGVRYAKGISQKIVTNTLLQSPTTSERAGYELLLDNKELIQNETIAFLSSSWSGVDGFSYNEAKCRRDVAYIVDAVATDLIYGGNERSSKAGEYYFLYPSAATVSGYANPAAQLDQTTTGIKFAGGLAQKLVQNTTLVAPSYEVESTKQLLRNNIRFIQNETIEYVDAFYPSLVYLREKCRRDVGYILDAVITDMVYGGNERGIVAGDYYYRFPSLATGRTQVRETVDAVRYARELSKLIAQNVDLQSPTFVKNIDGNIKVSSTTQYTSSVSATTEEVGKISSSFAIVTDIIQNGIETLPIVTSNVEGLIKVNDIPQITSSVSGGVYEVDLVSSSFKLIRDIIYNGSTSIPDSLASNYDYGFGNQNPTPLHITSITQSLGDGSQIVTSLTGSVSSSYGNVKNIITNGTGSIPTLIENTSASLKVSGINEQTSSVKGSSFDINRVGSSFGIVLNIIENGTSVIPTLISNTSSSIKVTDVPQFLSGSASRLQGKIVSSSIALVVDTLLNNGTSSIQYKAPSATPNSNTNVVRAYDLLINNIPLIQAETVQFMSSSWSEFVYNEASCSRDVGLIVSGAAFDLLYGGNSASYVNGRFYFDYPSEATSSQLDQTVTAIRYASGIAEKIIKGEVLMSITASILQPTSASWDLLRKNKGFIQSESIAYLSSSWSEFEYSQSTCARDVGYIVDAVATDLLYGGNERSIVAGDYYYRFPSTATTAQLEPTLTGVRYAKGLAMKIVSGSSFQTASAAVDYAYDIIKDNKLFIQSESVAFVNAKFPHLVYNEESCKRDVGYIVDAVITDLKWGGNERANKAGEFYYLFPSEATGVQVEETTAAVNYARLLTEQIMLNNLIAEPQPISNTSASIKVTNTPQYISSSISTEAGTYEIERISSSFALVSNIIENGLGVVPTLVSNISQSVKFTNSVQYTSGTSGNSSDVTAVSASISLVSNIVENGIGSLPALIPYTTPSTDVNTLAAYDLLRQNISFIQDETIAYLSSSWTTASYDEVKCRRDVGLIVSGAAEDLIWNSNSASLMNGYYYYLFPSLAETSQLKQTLDGINYANRLAQKVIQNVVFNVGSDERRTAWELVKNNMDFIKDETIAYLSSSWSTFDYSESVCRRDVGHILDAAVTDMFYGGNERSITAGEYYFRYPSSATISGSASPTSTAQLYPTLDGIRYAGRLAQKVAQNITFITTSAEVSASYHLLRDNLQFIQSESISFISSSWDGFVYNQETCKRDIGYIVDAVSTDLLYGGNERSVIAGDFYYRFPSNATTSEKDPTATGVEYAGGLSSKLIQNKVFVTASSDSLTIRELIRDNRPFIQDETMAYLTASWSTFDYDKVKCRRDVGYIVDAAATDLLYGGNERSVTAGKFYYLYPSLATVAGTTNGQLEETLDGIRYAGGVTQKVVQNTLFVTASQEVSASFDLLRKNKPFIQAETIAYVSSSWSGVYYNEASCSRDVGFLIDAVATDLLYGGQERSVTAGSFYYLFPSRATNAGVPSEQNQLDPTVTGIRYAGRLSSKVVQNPKYESPSASVWIARDLLLLNRTLIQKETITFLSSSWSTLQYNEVSCSRDLGFIIDAVATDLIYGGNERSIEAGSIYYRIPSVAIAESYTDNGEVGQKKQTVDGINFAKGITEKIVNNVVLTPPTTRTREAAQRLLASKETLKQQAIGYTNGAFPYLVYNEASCSRDTGLIVDALVTDLLYGGNERGIAAASSYYNGQYGSAAAVVNDQRTETLETNRYLRTRAEFIAAGAPLESFGSLIVATGIDYSYNGSGVTFKALPPNQGGSGVPNPDFEITELGGGRIFFTSGNQDGDFRIGTGLSINQATGTLVGRTFSKSLFSLVTPFSLALEG